MNGAKKKRGGNGRSFSAGVHAWAGEKHFIASAGTRPAKWLACVGKRARSGGDRGLFVLFATPFTDKKYSLL
jgi:hypothetical protein